MKLSYFEQTQIQSAILRAWQLNASAQGHPDEAWAKLAGYAVVMEIQSWDGRKNKRLTMKNTSEYTSKAKKGK